MGFGRFLRRNTIALLALFVALSGTTFAAANVVLPKNSVGAKQLKKNAVTTPKIKNHAVTGTKIKLSSLGKVPSAANADHATASDSATNAASAADAAKLGGVSASSYVMNAGSIFVSTGSSNWVALHSTDPISWTYTVNATWAIASGATSVDLTAHPSLPTGLYGKNLQVTSATLCYTASASAKIDAVFIYQNRYSTGGIGTANLVATDPTDRTDAACRTYPLATPVTLSSHDDIGFAIAVIYSGPATLFLGQSGVTLAPTSAAATAPATASERSIPATHTRGIVTH
jgi:hypothetical protein